MPVQLSNPTRHREATYVDGKIKFQGTVILFDDAPEIITSNLSVFMNASLKEDEEQWEHIGSVSNSGSFSVNLYNGSEALAPQVLAMYLAFVTELKALI